METAPATIFIGWGNGGRGAQHRLCAPTTY